MRQHRYAGTTLVELVVAIAMLTVLMGAVIPVITHTRRSWDTWKNNSEIVQNGRVLIDHMRRHLATAQKITAVSASSDTEGYIEFSDANSVVYRYGVPTGNQVEFGPVGSLADLAGPVSLFRFTCFDINDFTNPTVDVDTIRLVQVEAVFTDAAVGTQDKTFTTSVFLYCNDEKFTQGTPFEFDTVKGKRPALSQIDSTHYLCAYKGDGDDGWATVLAVDTATLAITQASSIEFDTIKGKEPSLTQMDGTHYLCTYQGDGDHGKALILTIDLATWNITKSTPFEFDADRGKAPAVAKIDTAHYLCAYQGKDDDGWVVVLSTDGLVAHWKFDEISGTSAADATGNGHTGTLNNMSGSEWTTGQVDGALEFDGSDDYVSVSSVAVPTTAFSFALWFKPDSNWSSGSGEQRFVDWTGSSPSRPYWTFSEDGDGKIGLHVKIDGTSYDDIKTQTTSWTSGTWYHLAVTWNGTDFKVYVNGTQEGPDVTHSGSHMSNTGLHIGQNASSSDRFDGQLDDLRIYSYALSPSEVTALTQVLSFEEFTEAKAGTDTTSITIDTPASTSSGDLLITAVATDGDTDVSLASPAGEGWTEINTNSANSAVTLGTWWKIAGASESSTHQFTWSGSEQAYAWMMRFTGHDASDPINAYAANYGTSSTPTSPAVTSTVDNALILRLGGFDDPDITVDAPGLSGHTAITMDSSVFPKIESTTLSKETVGSANFAVSMPSTRPDGDLYLAQISQEGGALIDSIPSGWTEITDSENPGGVRFASYWKIGSSEPATYTWSGDPSKKWLGAIHRISGINKSSPINVSGDSTGESSSPAAPSVTAAVDNCLILRMYGAEGDEQAATYWPTETTPIFQDDTVGDVVSAAAHETQVTSGSTGSAAFSMTGSKKWIAATIAIAPPASSGPVSGAAGYVRQSSSGSSGTSDFSLTASEEARMVTIAIAPASQGPAPSAISRHTPYEFDTVKGKHCKLVRIDDTHYLCIYTGDGDDGWAVILIVDPLTWVVTKGTPLEYDTIKGKEASLAQIDSTHFMCVYQGNEKDWAYATVLSVNTVSNTVVQESVYLVENESEATTGKKPAVVGINGNRFLLAYEGKDQDGYAVVLTVDSDTWEVSIATPLEFDTVKGKEAELVKIDNDHYLCAYAGDGGDGWAVILQPGTQEILP
ncbi:MAG: hypothetical protein IIC50_19035 [Planctomycetes bacterium]|nr:hypothetical protein [Planctomycetota bacterium]